MDVHIHVERRNKVRHDVTPMESTNPDYIPTPGNSHAPQELKRQAEALRLEKVKQDVVAGLLFAVIALSGTLLGYALIFNFSKRCLRAAEANDDEEVGDDVIEDDELAMGAANWLKFKKRGYRESRDEISTEKHFRPANLKEILELLAEIDLEQHSH